MKGLFRTLAACAAIAAAGASQAVVIKWTETGAVSNKNVSQNVTGDNACASVSVVYAVTITSDFSPATGDDGTDLIKFGQWNRGNVWNKVSTQKGFYVSGQASSSGTSFAILEAGEDPITHVIVATYEKTSATTTTASWYLDGKLVCTQSFTGLNGLDVDVWAFDGLTSSLSAYDGILSADQIEWVSTNGVSILLEPTALALLALGVAGLALRRRAA